MTDVINPDNITLTTDEHTDTAAILNKTGEQSSPAAGSKSQKPMTVICASCGAELFCSPNAPAKSCPFCGGSELLSGVASSAMPDFFVPFFTDKATAAENCRRYCKSHLMLPPSFTSELDADSISAVYVPLWLYSGEAVTEMNFRCTDGGKPVNVRRSGVLRYGRLPISASSNLPRGFVESLMPYNFTSIVPFGTEWLGGHPAEAFDEDASDASDNEDGIGDILRQLGAEERQFGSRAVLDSERDILGDQAARIFRSRMPYSVESESSRTVKPHNTLHMRVLVPVWYLHTSWRGSDYYFGVNGQTGEVCAKLPFNQLRMFRLQVLSFSASLPAAFLLLMLVALSISSSPEAIPRFAVICGIISVAAAFFITYRFRLSLLAEGEPDDADYYTTFFARSVIEGNDAER